MLTNRVAENVLGTIGTVCWTAQILPQNWKSWRDHSTEGLSIYLVSLWALSAIFLGVYNVTQKINLPLIIQPQLFGVLSALSSSQCLYYSYNQPFWLCALALALYCTIGAVFETGMVFLTTRELQKGNLRPVQSFGILSSVTIAVGLLPQYWEIWKRKEVVGISYIFMTVDIAGAVFSLLSLALKPKFDIVAAVVYALVVVMDSVILLAAAILNPRARRLRASAASAASESTLQDVEVSRPVTKDIDATKL